jgi:hypothetical protein
MAIASSSEIGSPSTKLGSAKISPIRKNLRMSVREGPIDSDTTRRNRSATPYESISLISLDIRRLLGYPNKADVVRLRRHELNGFKKSPFSLSLDKLTDAEYDTFCGRNFMFYQSRGFVKFGLSSLAYLDRIYAGIRYLHVLPKFFFYPTFKTFFRILVGSENMKTIETRDDLEPGSPQ